jgi:hypothetical protein
MEAMQSLADNSRVWVYQSSRPFSDQEKDELNKRLRAFAAEWVSHNKQLSADASILHDRFIILMVDEHRAGASGCSIDSSVKFLKQLEQTFHIELFNRLLFSFIDTNNQIQTVDRTAFSSLYTNGIINDETKVFDTLVDTKKKLSEQFILPLSQSWHKKML